MLVFCQATYWERHEQTLECIKRVAPYVDRVVIVEPDYDIAWCTDVSTKYPNVEFYRVEWKDNFPEYRNEYLKRCKPGDWVCVADPDEWYGEKLCRDLRKITEKADRHGITLILVNSHDFITGVDGKTRTSISSFYKNLIFKYEEGVHYKGVGEAKNVHETLICAEGKSLSLDRKYFYEHHKTQLEVWERAFRNVWIGGGGNNAGERNPAWKPLREITEELGLKTWPEVRAYLRKGKIDKRLLDWIVEHRNDGGWNYENETGECFLYYFTMHPEENIKGWKHEPKEPSYGSPPEVTHFVWETYKKVLGREPDDSGKRYYTNQILAGNIRREDLPSLLKQSKEYKEKFPEKGEEKVRLHIPVDVDVRLTEGDIIKAMMRSDAYWKIIKPRIDFAKAIEELIDKDEFYRWFYQEKELTLDKIIEKLKEMAN